ncbi:TetR/AcrR family transcriptional regulator [Nonomuraea longicatena]|uniref:HTH tetR-type domain-containing protein n=1 Tax=Nonomuraea longicatena TaxID=83682 RepID=A0ABP3ZQ22_9ACTN
MANAERSTELLWSSEGKRRLSLDGIVRAAIALADEEGLRAASMRRVAERLGFTTMSLYRHVPGKAELVDLMRDHVFAEALRPPKPAGAGDARNTGSAGHTADTKNAGAGDRTGDAKNAGADSQGAGAGGHAADLEGAGATDAPGWREELEEWARGLLALTLRHPWLLDSGGPRSMPGPNIVAHFERALSVTVRTGLPPAEVVAAVTLLGDFVGGAARHLVEADREEQSTGVTHEEWWGGRDTLYEHLDLRYPTLNRLYEQGAYDDPADPFAYGLKRVLDGIAASISDETRDETRCKVCGTVTTPAPTGRPRDYCSRACQQRAYRQRRRTG